MANRRQEFFNFNSAAFEMQTLTASVNGLEFAPTRLDALGLFEVKGITSTRVMVEEQAGQIRLLPTSPRGAPANVYAPSRRRALEFDVPHLTVEHSIQADSLQNVRAFGSETEAQIIERILEERLQAMRLDVEVTTEYHRVGALRGQILDPDGAVLYDLHDEFGVSQQVQPFDFPTASTDVRLLCMAVRRMIEDELGAMPYSGLRAICGRAFFDALISHPSVAAAYERFQAGEQLRSDPHAGFLFGNILFEEYRGSVNGTPFVPTREAYVFPEGTTGLFLMHYAPADFVETVNTMGIPLYAKSAIDPEFQRWAKLHVQSNPLPLVCKPRCVVKCEATAP